MIMKTKPLFFAAASLIMLGALLLHGGVALAAPFARSANVGYFYSDTKTTGHNLFGYGELAIPDSVNTIDAFVAFYQGKLSDGVMKDYISASFTILSMLGYPAGTDPSVASGQFGTWSALVHDYAAAGRVQFFINYPFTVNTYYQDPQAGIPNGDVAWYNDTGSATSIVFYNEDGTAYAIKRDCANPVGPMSQLRQLGWTFSEGASANKASVYPGDSVTFTDWAHNNGPGTGYTQYYGEDQYFKSGAPTTGLIVNNYHGVTAFANGQTDTYSHTVGIPATAATQICNHSVTFWNSSYSPGNWGVSGWSCVSINQPAPQCTNPPTLSPASAETTVPFSMKTQVLYLDGASGLISAQNTGGSYYMIVKDTQTGAVLGGSSAGPQASGNSWSQTINFPATSTPTKYAVTWGVSGGSGAVSCSDSFIVANYPFFSVHGGDIITGASFATTPPSGSPVPCSAAPHNGSAGISSWNSGAPGYSGAGGDYAALAMDYIQGFVSDTKQGDAGLDLAFSNYSQNGGSGSSTNAASNLFGGLFGGTARTGGAMSCIDYWNNKPDLTAASVQNLGSSTTVSGAISDISTRTGNLTINGGSIPNGKHLTVYVNGNVNITGPITYQSNIWSSTADIPSFKLIVHGAIYINAHVDNLDGTYVAVPDHYSPSDAATTTNDFATLQPGTISTCSVVATPFKSYDPSNAAANGMVGQCNSQLVVNGSFMANQVYLARTFGTVSSNQPGEVFNYSPESWLSLSPTNNGQTGTYQSVVGLPPVL